MNNDDVKRKGVKCVMRYTDFMQFKKKYISLLFYLLSVICIVCVSGGCRIQRLVVPKYPLQKEDVEESLKEYDISCIVEEHSPTEESLSFSLRNEEDKALYAGIRSQQLEQGRTLGVTFLSFDSETDISEEECKKVILMATRLFGGFRNDQQVYKKFNKECQVEKDIRWKKEIEGIECEVKMEFVQAQQRYIMLVGFRE